MEDFDEFWSVYPRRVAKLAALKAYQRARKTASAEDILAGARRYAEQRQGQDTQFTAHAATWLNAGRWMDEEQHNGQRNDLMAAFDRLIARADGESVERDNRTIDLDPIRH